MFWLFRLIINRSIYSQSKKFTSKKIKHPFLRRLITYKLTRDKKNALRAVLYKTINLNNLEKTRKSLLEKENFKPSIFSLLIEKIGQALIENPEINTHSYKNKLVYFKTSNISFVVGREKPIEPSAIRTIEHVEKKSTKEIDVEIKKLVKNAKENPMDRKESLKVGGFAVSNFGSLGIDFGFTPSLFPYTASLGIGAKQQNGDAIFSISFDHKWIEGHAVSKFLFDLKNMIENK